jgi:hypothetical protein
MPTFVGDKELLNSIDFTKSQLHYAADQVLQSRAALLLKNGKDNRATVLRPMDSPPEVIGEMETTLTAFSNQVTNPRQAVIAKKRQP